MKNTFETTGDYIGDSFRLAKFVGELEKHIGFIARAYITLGNDAMATKMLDIGDDLVLIETGIKDIASNKSTKDLNEVTKQTGELMTKMLAKADSGRDL